LRPEILRNQSHALLFRLKTDKQSVEMDLAQMSAELQELKLEEKETNNDELIKEVEK